MLRVGGVSLYVLQAVELLLAVEVWRWRWFVVPCVAWLGGLRPGSVCWRSAGGRVLGWSGPVLGDRGAVVVLRLPGGSLIGGPGQVMSLGEVRAAFASDEVWRQCAGTGMPCPNCCAARAGRAWRAWGSGLGLVSAGLGSWAVLAGGVDVANTAGAEVRKRWRMADGGVRRRVAPPYGFGRGYWPEGS